MELYSGKVNGVTFAKKNLEKLIDYLNSVNSEERPRVILKHDLTNKFDKNAIKVFVGMIDNFFDVGWIPKEHNTKILEYKIENTKTTFSNFNIMNDVIVGLNIRVVVDSIVKQKEDICICCGNLLDNCVCYDNAG